MGTLEIVLGAVDMVLGTVEMEIVLGAVEMDLGTVEMEIVLGAVDLVLGTVEMEIVWRQFLQAVVFLRTVDMD